MIINIRCYGKIDGDYVDVDVKEDSRNDGRGLEKSC